MDLTWGSLPKAAAGSGSAIAKQLLNKLTHTIKTLHDAKNPLTLSLPTNSPKTQRQIISPFEIR